MPIRRRRRSDPGARTEADAPREPVARQRQAPPIGAVFRNLVRFAWLAFPFRGARRLLMAVLLLAAVAIGGYMGYSRVATRHIQVCIATDFAFRYEKPNWRYRVGLWFSEVNRVFRAARIEWQPVFTEEAFPEAAGRTLSSRRLSIQQSVSCPAGDVLLGLSGQRDAESNSVVAPFNRVLVAVVSTADSDAASFTILSRALAQLFGAAANTATLVNTASPDEILDDPALRVAEKLRWYPFRSGIAALNGEWERRAAQVIEDAYSGRLPHPDLEAHRTLGRAFAAGFLHANAVSQLRQALKTDPKSIPLRLELAIELNLDARMDEALEELAAACALDPDDARPHAMRGAILLNTRRRPEGIEELRIAAKLDPHNPNYLSALGRTLAQEVGGADEAERAFSAALRITQRDALANLGLAALKSAPETAQEEVSGAQAEVKRNPASSEAMYRLGLAFAAGANTGAARDAFLRSVALDRNNALAHLALAQVYYMAGDYQAAYEAMQTGAAAGGKADSAFVDAVKRRVEKK